MLLSSILGDMIFFNNNEKSGRGRRKYADKDADLVIDFDDFYQRLPQISSSPDSKSYSTSNLLEKKIDYVYVPALGLYISEKKYFSGKSWKEIQSILHLAKKRMPTIIEEIEFIKYLLSAKGKSHVKKANQILEDIFSSPNSTKDQKCECLDAQFKEIDGQSFFLYHAFSKSRSIVTIKEKMSPHLKSDSLNLFSGIDIQDWFTNYNSQGLPKPNCKVGTDNAHIFYIPPKNLTVAGLAGYGSRFALDCQLDPQISFNNPSSRIVSLSPDK